jgi:hypothetical protein
VSDPNWAAPSQAPSQGPSQAPSQAPSPTQGQTPSPVPSPVPSPAPSQAPSQESAEQLRPAVPPAEPTPLFVYGQQPVYPNMDAVQNWGMAVPRLNYAVLVPRPPRPTALSVALTLAYVGVGVAAVTQTANGIYQWSNRAQIFSTVETTAPTGVDARRLVDASATLGLVIAGLMYLVVAAGVITCAVLASRKKNGARITLAAAMGVIGLYNLCGLGGSALVGSLSDRLARSSPNSTFNFTAASAQVPWWALVGQGVLAVIALTVFVLLILRPTNRYFVAGAGRRFTPEV